MFERLYILVGVDDTGLSFPEVDRGQNAKWVIYSDALYG